MYDRKDMIKMKGPVSSRIPMDRVRRAKQFAPFQALKGFEHSVRQKEIIYEGRKIQYNIVREDLDRRLKEIGNREIRLTYYLESSVKPGFGSYLDVCGLPEVISHQRILRIDGMEIPFDDIVDIEAVEWEK